MAKAGSISVDLDLLTSKFEAGFKKVDRNFKDMRRQSRRVADEFSKLNSRIGFVTKSFLALAGVGTLGALTRSTVEAADNIGKLSTQLGISTEALSQYQFVAEQTGVGFETLTMGLQRMTRRIAEAAQGSGEAIGALNELGLSARALSQLPVEDQFEAIARSFEGVSSSSDKVRLAFKLFDSEGVRLLRTLDGGAAGIQRLREEADSLGLTLSKVDTDRAALVADAWNRIANTLRGVFRQVAFELIPVFEELAVSIRENLGPAVRGFLETFNLIKPKTRQVEELRQNIKRTEDNIAAMVGQMQKMADTPGVSPAQLEAFGRAIAIQEQGLAKMRETFGILTGDVAAVTAAAERQERQWQSLQGTTERAAKAQKEAVKDVADELGVMDRALDLIVKQFEDLDAQEAAKFAGLQKIGEDAEKATGQFEELKSAVEGWGKSFADELSTGEANFKGFAETIVKQLARIAITKLTGPYFDAFGDFIGSALGGAFGGARASGGPVTGGSSYLVGENGPELFVPRTSGTVVPNNRLTAGGATIAPVYNIDARGADAGAEQRIRAAMQETTARTVALIRDMKSRGSLPEFA